MSEPTYLALAPMNRMLHSVEPPRPPDEYSVPLGGYDQRHHPSVPPRLPPSRKSSVHEATHNYLADLKMLDQDTSPSWRSTPPIESPASESDDENDASFLRCVLYRDPEPDSTFIPPRHGFQTDETNPLPYRLDEWLSFQYPLQLADAYNEIYDEYHHHFLTFFENHQLERVDSPVDSMLNNWDSDDESIISSVASSIPAWSGSLSNLTMHVGASFLELTPRRDSNGP
ncbi:uncharacterized protein CIMG_10907 [Coccidioides immitis RS]|uniref:Uncharacterized protein n=3 Tax=Coccidioides immitis TaxID=5501 RepID=A0A0D8JSB9_COCIM|nr:uncharacterized protein CIMG_10907 [Coccidioides immitis RS]KJF60039.1 hypothetical protein CIMG_10907 [Coccidioides immitis RS]KMP09844.1 hypothetical protein CIRG_09077 [Coccidioides immitis RMSCC 2394]TPX25017.1 hypothetical protein DIZ76_010466 [Coccidioides immitis]